MQSNFFSTKRFGPISTAHRQWRHKGHCSFIHGYGRTVELIFACSALDDKGWVVDFGALNDVRKFIESQWDHRLLVAEDDPHLEYLQEMETRGLVHLNIMRAPYGPGMEKSALFLFDSLDPEIRHITKQRCWIHEVRVWEHENNSAIYKRPPIIGVTQ